VRRAVLCDLDGTLVDSSADLSAAVNRARTEIGLEPLPLETVRGFIGDGVQVLLERAIPRPAAIPQAIEAFRAYYEGHLLDETHPYDGIEAALDALAAQGLRLGVVTNKPESFARRILESTGLARFFGVVVGGDSLAERKPAAGPFRAALERLAAVPERSLMVGDGRNDVIGARNAGMPSCGVGWGIGDRVELRALSPDYWVERPEDLPPLVASLGKPT
jgi:phosphoglycolate phosphatase